MRFVQTCPALHKELAGLADTIATTVPCPHDTSVTVMSHDEGTMRGEFVDFCCNVSALYGSTSVDEALIYLQVTADEMVRVFVKTLNFADDIEAVVNVIAFPFEEPEEAYYPYLVTLTDSVTGSELVPREAPIDTVLTTIEKYLKAHMNTIFQNHGQLVALSEVELHLTHEDWYAIETITDHFSLELDDEAEGILWGALLDDTVVVYVEGMDYEGDEFRVRIMEFPYLQPDNIKYPFTCEEVGYS